MAPINLPDGTEVSEIVLPDGSTASELLAPDGSSVFRAIPDSGIYRLNYEDDSDTSTAIDFWDNEPHNGTISGATYDSDAYEGNFSLLFDNSQSHYVDMGDDDSFTQDQLTIAQPVKIQSVPSRQTLASKAGGGGSREYIFQIRDDGSGTAVLYADVGDTSGAWDINYESAVTVPTDTWTLAGLVIDTANSEVRFHKNDQTPETTAYNGGGLKNTAQNLVLGAQTTVGDGVLDGRLDVSDMYAKALSNSEFADLYNTGSI